MSSQSTILCFKRYSDISDFLKATERFLHDEEIRNALLLAMSHEIRDNDTSNKKPYFCGAVWNKKRQLVFAILAKHEDCLYASSLFDDAAREAIPLLLKHLLNTDIVSIQAIHAYQPVLQAVEDIIEHHQQRQFKPKLPVWSYKLISKHIHWSKRAKEVAYNNTTKLRLATDNDASLIQSWTCAFIRDAFHESDPDLTAINTMCNSRIDSGQVYLLCVKGSPVTMAWQLRPLKFGCSLGYVYTPPEHRHQGYGAACVTMLSDALLKVFQYVTLFVEKDQNREDNLYTRIGYEYYGEAGRFIAMDK